MAKIKDIFEVYVAIHEAFKNFKKDFLSFNELKKHLEKTLDRSISERSLKAYLSEMKNPPFFAPIENRRGKGYYYKDKSYNLLGARINEASIEQLYLAYQVCSQLGNNKTSKVLKETISLFTEFKQPEASILLNMPNGPSLTKLDLLHEYIWQQQVIQFDYQGHHKREGTTQTVSPLLLRQYEKIWYLLGYNHGSPGKLINYGIDRIGNLRKANNVSFQKPEGFNAFEVYQDSFGISLMTKDNLIDVTLKVYDPIRHYFIEWPFHQSQKIMQTDTNFSIYTYKVYNGSDLLRGILGYCEYIEILSPKELREKVSESLKKGLERNNNRA